MIGAPARAESDWYVELLDVIQSSITHLQGTLARSSSVLVQARAQRLTGISLFDLVESQLAAGGTEARIASYRAFHDFEHAVTAYRAGVIRALVDDERMTFTQVGELLGVSRQLIARLYSSIRDPQSPRVSDPI
jgi:hypothetical protein